MKRHILLRIIAMLLLSTSSDFCRSQIMFQKTYGTTKDEDGIFIIQTTDGGYIINARSAAPAKEDAYLLKINSTGTLQWSKSYGGTDHEEGWGIAQSSDGGYVIAGETMSFGAGSWDVYFQKVDSAGNLLWRRTFGKSTDESAFAFEQTNSGDYLIAAMTNSFGSGGFDFYLIKTDANGNLLWENVIGGPSDEWCHAVRQTTDGGYIMTGSTQSFGAGNADIYVVKTDASGTMQWTKTYGGAGTEVGYNIQQTADGGYIIVGITTISNPTAYDIVLLKTDVAGNLQWANKYGGTNMDYAFFVQQTTDGGYIISGGTTSFGFGSYDVFLLKTDTIGNLTWSKTYGGTGMDGAFLAGAAPARSCVRQTSDGGYIISTLTMSFGAGSWDVYLIKTDANGNSGCNETNPSPSVNTWSPTVFFGGIAAAGGAIVNTPNPTTNNYTTVTAVMCSTSCSPPVANAGNNVTICQGQNTTLVATGGGSYSWSPASGLSNTTIANPIANPTTSTTYMVVVNDTCGSSSDAVTVTVNLLPVANAGADVTICPGDNVTLIGSGGGIYTWSAGGQTTSSVVVNPTSTTTYTLSVSNSCGFSTDVVNVVISNTLNAAIFGNTTICSGQLTTLTASGGTSYSWNNGVTTTSIIVSPTLTTTYSVIVSSGTCSDTASATVTISSPPVISAGSNVTVCTGTNVTLTASGGITYVWNTGATTASITVSPTANTTYTVSGTDANGCTATAFVAVTVTSSIIANAGSDGTICVGDNFQLNASGGTGYSWIPSTGLSNPNIYNPIASPTGTITYTVIVTSGSCTPASDSVTVYVVPNPIAVAWSNVIITAGNSTTLSASGGTSYSWSNGAITSIITVSPAVTTVYCVTVTDANGCTDSECVTVYVEPPDCSTAGEFYLPNAFSPNNDSENDELKIYFGNFDCIEKLSIIVYNRWGEKVFEANEPYFRWNGTHRNKISDSGVYVYYLKVLLSGGTEINRKGNVSIIR